MKEKKKKIFEIIFSVVSITVLLVTMALFIFAVVSKVKNQSPQIFGYSLHFVVTDSMEDEIMVGDLVVGKKTDIMDIKVGDDILFVSPDPSLNGITIVHRVRSIDDSDGVRKIYTYGIKYNKDDNSNYPVTSIIGKVSTVSSFWGKVFNPMGMIFIVMIIVALSVLYFATKSFIKTQRALKKEKAISSIDDSEECKVPDDDSLQIQTQIDKEPDDSD